MFESSRMHVPSSWLMLPALVAWAATAAFGGGVLGEDLPAFEAAFPQRHVLRDAPSKNESCMTFLKDGWKGIACFRDGACALLLLLPADDANASEEHIVAGLDLIHPGLTWEKKDGRIECADATCHGATFPDGRGAYLIANDAQKQAKSRKFLSKDMFSQSMTTALLRLGDPVDYDHGVLVWETAQMRIGVPVCSSEMAYLVWEPTRQKKLRDKKVMRMTKDLISVDFNAPSYAQRTYGTGTLIGFGKDYLYCLIRNTDGLYSYTVCKSSLRYDDLEEMAEGLVFPKPRPEKTTPRPGADEKPRPDNAAPPSTGPAPAAPQPSEHATEPQKPAEPVQPPPVPEKHEELLQSFIESLEKA